jgi:hypothetical protein
MVDVVITLVNELKRRALLPAHFYFSSIEVSEDSQQALYIGIAIGIVTLTILTMNPGRPFDYSSGQCVEGLNQIFT